MPLVVSLVQKPSNCLQKSNWLGFNFMIWSSAINYGLVFIGVDYDTQIPVLIQINAILGRQYYPKNFTEDFTD